MSNKYVHDFYSNLSHACNSVTIERYHEDRIQDTSSCSTLLQGDFVRGSGKQSRGHRGGWWRFDPDVVARPLAPRHCNNKKH